MSKCNPLIVDEYSATAVMATMLMAINMPRKRRILTEAEHLRAAKVRERRDWNAEVEARKQAKKAAKPQPDQPAQEDK